ncbi:MAG TPA: hypothetical protein VGK99_04660 [Acidobacteriota bacterium]
MLALRKIELESLLKEKHLFPNFSSFSSDFQEKLGTSLPALNDLLSGGLPRGQISEITGPISSGKSSLLYSVLAQATRQREVVACVDCNQFDPWSAYRSGLDLKKLLWVRCSQSYQLLKAADILCNAGNFGVIALDMINLKRAGLYGPDVWFRLQRIVEGTKTVLLVLSVHPQARTASRLTLSLKKKDLYWEGRQSTWKLLQGFSMEVNCARGKRDMTKVLVSRQSRKTA